MTLEELESNPGVGFSFEAPVPLPLLGHRFCYPMRVGPLDTLVFVELKICDTQRLGTTKLSATGALMYHNHDRFGVFAYSAVEIRFRTTVESLVTHGLLHAYRIEEGKPTAVLKPASFAHFICAEVFNYFVDVQTVSFETHWVPHITAADLHSLAVMNWANPKSPEVLGMLSGVPGRTFSLALQPGFPTRDPVRVKDVLSKLPLRLWEEILNSALSDIEVGKFRSGVMHACLGVEAYMRDVLASNIEHVPDKHFLNKTLKPLATRKGCLPALIGYSLDSARAPSTVRQTFQRIAALRDAVMHSGTLVYDYPAASTTAVSLALPVDVADHVDMALSLITSIAEALEERGFQSGNRGLVAKAVRREDVATMSETV